MYKYFFKNISYDYSSIIITWGNINNLKKMVLLKINILIKIQEKNKKFLWFVISLDNKIPKNLNENIVIFYIKI